MAAQGGVGSRIYSFGNTSGGGGGGGGSAAFRPPVEARDSVNALKPTGAVTIDGAPINITGQRVLFTNLSGAQLADNNKVFAATVAAGLVTAWTLQTDGQAGDGNPTDGDNLYVRSGTVNGDREVFYNGTAWFIPAGGANTALSNLTATGINVALVPNATGTLDLGSAPLQWRRINVQQVRDNINNTVLDVNNRILNDSANATALNFSDATNIIFHKHLVPSANNTLDVGSSINILRQVYSNIYSIGLSGQALSTSTPSGATAITFRAIGLGGHVGLTTANNGTPDAVASGNVYIESGNKTVGTGDSGGIFISSGSSAGGIRGALHFNERSLPAAVNGYVWALQDQTTGRGAWVAAAATGANTTLSNLTSPTAINQTLRPDTTHSRDLGTSSLNWNTGYFGITAYSNATLALNGLIRGTNGTQTIDGDTYTANAYFLIEGAGASNNAPILIQTPNRNNLATGRIVLVTGTDVNAAGQKTGDIKFITGDSFNGTGTGPTGDILLKTGVTAGTRGTIRFQDASLAASVVGYVWRLQNITTGAGAWAAVPAPTGSNNTVAYFNGTGALSSEANFSFNTSIKSFSIYSGTGTATASGFSSVAWGRIDSASASITSSGAGSWAIGYATGVGGQIDSQDAGTFAGGFANVGKIISENSGSFAFGNIGGNTASRIRATTGGGVAMGGAGDGGTIVSSNVGAVVIGHSFGGAGASLAASGDGSHVFGAADGGSPTAITASAIGSGARGSSQNGGIVRAITGAGSWASGRAFSTSSLINASGVGAHAFGFANVGGTLTATANGNIVFGMAESSGIVRAQTGLGNFASGYSNGTGSFLSSEGQGSHVLGSTTGGGQMTASANGALAVGSSANGGRHNATAAGSVAIGATNGTLCRLEATQSGAHVFGTIASDAIIRASEQGAFARGQASDASTIIASGQGSLAMGRAQTGGSILASGVGAVASGFADNSATFNVSASGTASFAHGRRHTVSGDFASAFGEGHTVSSYGAFAVGRFASIVGTPTTVVNTEIAFAVGIGVAGTPLNAFSVGKNADIKVNRTITAGGVTGDQTIDKPAGTVNFAAAATTLTVTNNLVTIDSIVFAVVRTNDTTAVIKNVVPAAGSFVINLEAAATAETSVGFFVLN